MGRAAPIAELVTDDATPIQLSGDLPRRSVRRSLRQPVARLAGIGIGPLLYAGAAVSYIALGVFVNDFMLSWVVGFAWLLLWVWALPAVVRRLRR
jgi:hypothetical protein